MSIPEKIAALREDMIAWRHDLHEYPEIGYEEHRTSDFVAEKLNAWGIEVHRGLGKTGLVGVLKGRPGNRSIGLRADMDALAMEEHNDFAYASKIPNRMHGCGHEGHTTMLLGAAKTLAETKNFAGTVNLIFQPAEEGLAGAKAMIDDGLFDRFPCDAVYGIHNDPTNDLGLVNVRAGTMLASSDFFVITIHGKGCHGGQPNLGIDPIVASAQVINALQALVARRVSPTDTAVISIGQIHGGTSDNVIPEDVTLRGTVRILKPETRTMVEKLFHQAVQGAVAGSGTTVDIEYRRGYPPTINTAKEAEEAARAAAEIVGASSILHHEPSWTASEDFGYMLEQRPGAYAFFGQRGKDRGGVALHNPRYDFNDDLLPLGAGFFVTLTEQLLGT